MHFDNALWVASVASGLLAALVYLIFIVYCNISTDLKVLRWS